MKNLTSTPQWIIFRRTLVLVAAIYYLVVQIRGLHAAVLVLSGSQTELEENLVYRSPNIVQAFQSTEILSPIQPQNRFPVVYIGATANGTRECQPSGGVEALYNTDWIDTAGPSSRAG